MSVRIHLTPGTPWAARLERADQPLSLQMLPDSRAREESLPAAVLAAHETTNPWPVLEPYLWNDLLPDQHVSGIFGPEAAPDYAKTASMMAMLQRAVMLEDTKLVVGLPIDGVIEGDLHGERLTWQIETRYPQQGYTSATFRGQAETDLDLLLHIPPFAQAVQLVRNGQVSTLEWVSGSLRAAGPWNSGDNLTVRFGIPFRALKYGQDLLKDRPVERSFPGAAPMNQAVLYHGFRALAPLMPPENPPVALGAGIRKDGVILLQCWEDHPTSPFAGTGDFFLTSGPHTEPLAVRAVWSSVSDERVPDGPWQLTFHPFATAFDRGA